jgi:hypothetical protein
MKMYFQQYAMDGGLIIKKFRDSLERLPREGVSSNLGRLSKIGRPTFLPEDTGGATVAPPQPHGGAMAGGSPDMPNPH